jgi:hypothetical protein
MTPSTALREAATPAAATTRGRDSAHLELEARLVTLAGLFDFVE